MELRVNGYDRESLAQRLRDAREAISFSQVELAEHFSVSARTVQYWEAGKVPQPKKRREVLDFIEFVEARRAA